MADRDAEVELARVQLLSPEQSGDSSTTQDVLDALNSLLDAKNALVAIEPHRNGDAVSKWSWGSGRVVVSAVDGLTHEYVLSRRAEPGGVASGGRTSSAGRSGGEDSGSEWAPWKRDRATSTRTQTRRDQRRARREQQPKSLFDLLFGN